MKSATAPMARTIDNLEVLVLSITLSTDVARS